MNRIRYLGVVSVGLIVLLLTFGTIHAEDPTPSATPNPFCEAASLPGGDTYVIGAVEVTLPAGTYNLISPPTDPEPAFPHVVLCHKESGGILNLNIANCEENSRDAATEEAESVLDAIVASCHLTPTPTPAPLPVLCPDGDPVAGGGQVTIDDSIQVTLPAGDFFVQVANDAAGICNRTERYMLALRLSDCGRPDIEPPLAPAHEVMAQIVNSCVLLHPVTPVPTPPIPPSTGVITPPSTGSAGLKADCEPTTVNQKLD